MDLLHSMTVEELISELQQHDPNALVVFEYNYGDRGRTRAVGAIERIQVETLEKSAYSNSGFAVATTEDGEEYDDDAPTEYVVLG